jgi:hypothetical protein
MSFEPIGPYGYNRRDIVAAAVVVSFVMGALRVRLWAYLIVAAGLAVCAIGIVMGDAIMACIAIGIVLGVFLIGPALRSRKRAQNIRFSYTVEGLVAETDDVRTTYKWSTIRSYRKIGSRLFIMISEGLTLIVADRFTDAANMRRLMATLADRPAS